VLAIRIKGKDISTTSSMVEISNAIFGTGGDQINLKERYASCSYGQLQMEPYSGTTKSGYSIPENGNAVGVVEVVINKKVKGATDSSIENAAFNAATALLGNLKSQFDHVMLCLPPGISGGWIAYGKFVRPLAIFVRWLSSRARKGSFDVDSDLRVHFLSISLYQ
jgi:hypothetical protein